MRQAQSLARAIGMQADRSVAIPADVVVTDTETFGLDPEVHCVWEVAWAVGDGPIETLVLPHDEEDVTWADPKALEVNRYHDRGILPDEHATPEQIHRFLDAYRCEDPKGRHLAGAKPSFDEQMLRSTLRLGTVTPWHHRTISIPDRCATMLGWPSIRSVADTAEALHDLGFLIPAPDHSAAGDVAAERECLRATYALHDAYGLPRAFLRARVA